MESKEILDLFDKFEKSSLTEIQIKQDKFEVTMKKGGGEVQIVSSAAPIQTAHVMHAPSAVPEQAHVAIQKKSDTEIIESPMVGTFYRAPAPDAPPFTDIGKKMRKGDTLCILEAMKMMNEFESELDCEIVSILVENGTMVEFGTPLFEVKKT